VDSISHIENQTRFSPAQTKRGSAAVSGAAYCVRLLSLVSARSKCRPNYIYRRRLRAHTHTPSPVVWHNSNDGRVSPADAIRLVARDRTHAKKTTKKSSRQPTKRELTCFTY
jgi:hypothetical protein